MSVSLSSFVAWMAVLLIAPAVAGIATRTKALLTGRRGAPMAQLYYDLGKLLRRGAVYSSTTTWMFRLAPVVTVATVLLAAAIVPFDGRASLLRFKGDAVAFAYLLGLGRFILVLAALDTGSSFEGMGASREVTFASIVEVGLFLSLAGLAVAAHELSLTGMFGADLAARWSGNLAPLIMIAVSLFGLLLAESSRVPVDDPATHLELTMVHEVMVLDHSGPDLALILYGSAVKLTVFGALIVGVLIPRASLSPVLSIAALVAGVLGVGVGVGVVESVMARLRLPRVPLYIAGASALSLFSLILLLR